MTPAAVALAKKALAMVEAGRPDDAVRAVLKQLTDTIERDHAAAAPARKY